LGYQGVTGLAYVSLNDDGSSSELLVAAGEEPPRIGLRPSVFDTGLDLVAAINELTGRMSDVLNDENRQLLNRALAGIAQASQKTAALAEQLQPGAQGLPALVGDARSALAGAENFMASLKERAVAFDKMAASLEEVGIAARSFGDETLPRFNALVEQLGRDTRAFDRVFSALDENPQSFVFGAPRRKPGPGEPGFKDGAR
jgi:phospholipid/cholesterol/gamma-HCH transport system substrate-binding protein